MKTVSGHKETLENWYVAMKNFEYEKAETLKEQIESNLNDYKDPEIWKFYRLLLGRYYLYSHFEEAKKIIKSIDPHQSDKFHWLNYYHNFFNGILHYQLQEFQTSIEYYLKAKQFITDIDLEESAELLYKLGSAYFHDYQYTRSIKYGTRALQIFSSKSKFRRMADCNNLLGINYNHIFDYKKAEDHYRSALFYVDKVNETRLKTLLLHNLGYLYAELNEWTLAIEYLNQAHQTTPKDIEFFKYFKCKNLFILSRSHFLIGNKEKGIAFLKQGLHHTKKHGYLDYYHHLKVLECKYLNPEPKTYINKYQKAIQFFHDHSEWEYVSEASEELALYLRSLEKHKEATRFFRLAIDAKERLFNLT